MQGRNSHFVLNKNTFPQWGMKWDMKWGTTRAISHVRTSMCGQFDTHPPSPPRYSLPPQPVAHGVCPGRPAFG